MAARPGRSVLSLQGVALADRQFSAHTARLDLELPHGEVALVQVEDEHDAAMLVDLCLGTRRSRRRRGALSRRRLGGPHAARALPSPAPHRRRDADRCLAVAHDGAGIGPGGPRLPFQPAAGRGHRRRHPACPPVRPARPAGRAARRHPGARLGAGRLRARIYRLARPDRGTGSGARPVIRARRADGAGDLGGMRPRRHGAVDHRKSRDAGRSVRPAEPGVPAGRSRS